MSILSAALTLFLVMDPLGNVPLFATLLRGVEPRKRPWVIIRENVIALIILTFFLLAGPGLMRLLHIETPALSIAGGIVLLLIALEMIFHHFGGVIAHVEATAEPLIVPLAIPLIAGPSAMTVVMLMSTQQPGQIALSVSALLIAWAAGLIILLLSTKLQLLLGDRGLAATERLMGMILVVVAVQMAMSGVRMFMQQH